MVRPSNDQWLERPASSTANDVAIGKTGFEIAITQSLPWTATTYLEGTFEGDVDSNATTVKVTFDKAYVKADGTKYALNLDSGTKVLDLKYTSSPTTTNVPAKVTSHDPKRLLIKSWGFGPQGAEKHLDAFLLKPPSGPEAERWVRHAEETLVSLRSNEPVSGEPEQ